MHDIGCLMCAHGCREVDSGSNIDGAGSKSMGG